MKANEQVVVRILPLIIAVLILLTGCARARSAGDLVFHDIHGEAIARGTLRLPDQLPQSNERFEGSRRLRSSGASFPADAVKSGRYAGSVHDQRVSINLNPGTADNNIVLSGSVANGIFSGKWYHARLAGAEEMGSFIVKRFVECDLSR